MLYNMSHVIRYYPMNWLYGYSIWYFRIILYLSCDILSKLWYHILNHLLAIKYTMNVIRCTLYLTWMLGWRSYTSIVLLLHIYVLYLFYNCTIYYTFATYWTMESFSFAKLKCILSPHQTNFFQNTKFLWCRCNRNERNILALRLNPIGCSFICTFA